MGFTWNWESINKNDVSTWPKKLDDIFSRLGYKNHTIHERDRRTDGRTPDDSKDRAYA